MAGSTILRFVVAFGMLFSGCERLSSHFRGASLEGGEVSLFDVSPNSGLTTGGFVITLRGENLRAGVKVFLGSSECTSVSLVSATELTCQAPSASPGYTNVEVRLGNNTLAVLNNIFEYRLLPSNGSGVESNQITYKTPAASTTRQVDVEVINDDGQNTVFTKGYVYKNAPTLLAVSPKVGPANGGMLVSVMGTGFFKDASILPSVVLDGGECSEAALSSDELNISCKTPSHLPGKVSVKVTNPDGQSVERVDLFEYLDTPFIATISPSNGPTSGGTRLSIVGSGFHQDAETFVAGKPCTSPSISLLKIDCTAPSHGVDAVVTVSVQNPDNQVVEKTDAFRYSDVPEVISVNPIQGPTAGGTEVTLTGLNLFMQTSVLLGQAFCVPKSSASKGRELKCTTEASQTTGKVNVKTTNANGETFTLPSGFTYQSSSPVVSSVTPSAGPASGGTAIVIYGSDFLELGSTKPTVDLGGSLCVNTTFFSKTELRCTTASHSDGKVRVTVTNPDGGQGYKDAGFEYIPPLDITKVTPAFGMSGGGYIVTIDGLGFITNGTEKPSVILGASPCSNVTVISSSRLTCMAASSSIVGPVSVRVTNSTNDSKAKSGLFVYSNVPSVSGVYPGSGSRLGGTNVTVSGNNFYPASGWNISFDGSACMGVNVSSSTQLTCTTSAHATGYVKATVTNPYGLANTSMSPLFNFVGEPPAPSTFTVNSFFNGGIPFVTLNWTISDTQPYCLLVRRTGSPVTLVPSEGQPYSAGVTNGDNKILYSHTCSRLYWEDNEIQSGNIYYYKLFAYNPNILLYSAPVSANISLSAPPTGDLVASGNIYALAQHNGTIFLGGDFTRIGKYTGSGTLLDSQTLSPLSVQPPAINGSVKAVVPDPSTSGAFFIGGYFTRIGDRTVKFLARIKPDASIDTEWNPVLKMGPHAMTISGNSLYYVGGYSPVGSIAGNFIAEVDITTGAVQQWNVNFDKGPYSIHIHGDRMYVGGMFKTVGSENRLGLAVFDLKTKTLLPFSISLGNSLNPNLFSVYSIAATEDIVYIAGIFDSVNGVSRNKIAAVDASTGELLPWNPSPTGASLEVGRLVVSDGVLNVAGTFDQISGVSRTGFARYQASTGEILPDFGIQVYQGRITQVGNRLILSRWVENGVYTLGLMDSTTGQPVVGDTPPLLSGGSLYEGNMETAAQSGNVIFVGGTFQFLGGEVRRSLAAVDAKTGSLLPLTLPPIILTLGAGMGVRALAVANNRLYVGGRFGQVGNSSRASLASIDLTTGQLTTWAPSLNNDVWRITLQGSRLYVMGRFTSVDNQSRNGIAAFDTQTHLLNTWNPSLIINPAQAWIGAATVQNGIVYVGGNFSTTGGEGQNKLAAVDGTTGELLAWNPGATATSSIKDLVTTSDRIYILEDDYSNKALRAVNMTGAKVFSMSDTLISGRGVLLGSKLYLLGGASQVSGQYRNGLAAIDISSSSTTPWNPVPFCGRSSSTFFTTALITGSTVIGVSGYNCLGRVLLE